MNAIFQEYKRQVDELRKAGECKVVLVDDLEIPFKILPTEFNISDRKNSKYNRLEKKREDKELIREYEEDDERCY